jgi:hypothetical protein
VIRLRVGGDYKVVNRQPAEEGVTVETGAAQGQRDSTVYQPKLQSISVGKDESVWGIDKQGAALENQAGPVPSWVPLESAPASWVAVDTYAMSYGIVNGTAMSRSSEVEEPWQSMPGSPDNLKAIWAGFMPTTEAVILYAIDKSQVIWAWVPPDSEWKKTDRTAEAVIPTEDGGVAYLSEHGKVSIATDGTPTPIPAPEQIISLAAGAEADLWAVGTSGTVFHYDGEDTWVEESNRGQFPSGSISAGDDGTVWVLAGAAYVYETGSGTWTEAPGHFPGTMIQVSVASSQEIWAVESSGKVYRYTTDPNIWVVPPGGMGPAGVQISAVEADLVWTLDSSGMARECRAAGGGWTVTEAAGLNAKWISASAGEVLGLDANGAAHCYASGKWTQLSSSPELIRVDAAEGNMRAALDAQGTVYTWNPGQSGWTALPRTTTPIVAIAMADGGGVLALDDTQALWLYLEQWVQCGAAPDPEGLVQISMHNPSDAWGITKSGVPVSLGSLGEVGPTMRARGLPGWDTESVNDETRSTHLWIVNRGANLARGQGAQGERIANLVAPGGQDSEFRQQLRQGLYDADFESPYNNKVLFVTTYKSHFYDASTGKNWWGDTNPTALTQGTLYYNEAAAAFKANNMQTAGYKLGLALHYLTDLTQPMHAANFTWLSSSPVTGYHTSFEEYVLEVQAGVSSPTTYTAVNYGQKPEPYLIHAAQNSKGKYFQQLCPDLVRGYYWWFSSYYEGLAKKWAPSMLRDAINVTSQFLVAWMQAAEASASPAADGEATGSQVESAP